MELLSRGSGVRFAPARNQREIDHYPGSTIICSVTSGLLANRRTNSTAAKNIKRNRAPNPFRLQRTVRLTVVSCKLTLSSWSPLAVPRFRQASHPTKAVNRHASGANQHVFCKLRLRSQRLTHPVTAPSFLLCGMNPTLPLLHPRCQRGFSTSKTQGAAERRTQVCPCWTNLPGRNNLNNGFPVIDR